MSAHAYIQYADVPDELIASSHQRVDDVTRAQLIVFDGCPFSGQLDWVGNRQQVEYPFPRNAELRAALVDWLTHHSISFTVVM